MSLPRPHVSREARRLGLKIGRCVAGKTRRLVWLRLWHDRVQVVVDQQPPHLLVGVTADELLDVDAPIAEDAAFTVRLGDLRLDRDDAFEPWLEVRDFAHPPGRYLSVDLAAG